MPRKKMKYQSVVPSVAIVGSGYWGKNLVRNFADLGALRAVADADSDTATRIAGEHGVVEQDLHRILADETIEGVVIAAPAAEHHALVRDAMRAGKDVFVEKPLALELAQAEELVALGQDWSEADVARMQGRICEPEEVAAAALFLASNDASFINGEMLTVDNAQMATT